jgi:NADH-quinone oxidoreductase subunit M
MSIQAKRTQKFRAKTYLIFFTVFGGIPFLFFILWIIQIGGSSNIFIIAKQINLKIFDQSLTLEIINCIFIGFLFPFIVKSAIFPFHGWLPEAHVEAHTEGSILLSGIILKLGFFGLVKFTSLFFISTIYFSSFKLFTIFVITITPPACALFSNTDIKKIIAYYSVVHMHISIIGIISINSLAIEAAIFINLSHAVTSAGLFASVGVVYEKLKSRNLTEITGLINKKPIWTIFFFILLLSNAGIPGTISFAPEISLIAGIVENFPMETIYLFVWAGIAGVRSFSLFNQICLGPNSINHAKFPFHGNKFYFYSLYKNVEIGTKENFTLKFFSIFIVFFGFQGGPFIIEILPKLVL